MNDNTSRFKRYTAAFIDYKVATANFDEAVFNAAKEGKKTSEFIDISADILTIKHARFIECAQHLFD